MTAPNVDPPGLLDRFLADDTARCVPLAVRTLDLALKTRPGETLGDPGLGLPCFADLVHSDRAAAHSLRIQLRHLLQGLGPEGQGIEIHAHLDREAGALRIDLSQGTRHGTARQRMATATIDAFGITALETTNGPQTPRRWR